MQLSADSGKGKTKKSKHKAQHKTVFDVIGRPHNHKKSHNKPKTNPYNIIKHQLTKKVGYGASAPKKHSHHQDSAMTDNRRYNNMHSSHKGTPTKHSTSHSSHKTTTHHTSTTHKPVSKASAYHNAVKHAATHGAAPTTHHAAPKNSNKASHHSSHSSHGTTTKPVSTKKHVTNTKPVPKPSKGVKYTKPVMPKIGAKDQAWYDAYGKTIQSGTANVHQYNHYMALQKKYGLDAYNTSNDVLHNMSLKALGGDKNAQAYMKAMHITAQDAKHGLWKGYDPNKDTNKTLQHYYRVDNPNAGYTKNYDNGRYNAYNDLIMNNKQMTDDQMKNYNRIVGKYHLQDMTDPYNQQVYRNNQDRNQQLQAQDISTNQSLATSDAQNFQALQAQQQNMADRGITDSGIAAGAYQQSIAANNQNVSKAYADMAANKAQINQQYDQLNYGVKQDQQNAQAQAAALQEKTQMDLLNAQTNQDKYMTASTGYVYVGGKPLQMNGKPIRSMDYQKLSETQRHNLALENNMADSNKIKATKNAQDYEISNKKIAADLTKSIAKNKLDYAKLDLDYKKLASQNSYNQAKLNSLADASTDRKRGQQLKALGKQSSDLSHQIQAYQKKGKKPPSKLVDKYNNVNDSINKLIGGMSFNDGSGGDVKIGKMGTYGNYWKTQKEFAHSSGAQTFVSRLNTVVKGGQVPQSWMKGLIELAGRESSWNPNAQNGHSTAHGYAQFLNSTERLYKKRYPNLDYSNPVDQIVLMYHYIKDKYGTVNKALAWWDAHNWY